MSNLATTDYVKNSNSISSISYLGVALLLITTVLNTSQFGASFSWVIVPCLLILAGCLLRKERLFVVNSEFIYIFLFWLAFVSSTMVSTIVSVERNLATFFVFCLVYVGATSYSYTRKQIGKLINICIIVSIYIDLNIVYNWVTDNYYNEWFKRASFLFAGVYKDPNYVMAFVVPAIAFAFIKMINSKNRRERISLMAFILLSIVAIFATGSRTPMLVIAIFLIAYFLLSSEMKLKKKRAIIMATLLIVALALFIVGHFYSEHALERLLRGSEDSRWKLWEISLEVFKAHPIIGGGMSAASTITTAIEGHDSHNVYLDILCNSGLIGFFVFFLLISKACLKTTKKNRAFIYSLFITFMLPMMFINGFNTATFYTPIIMMSILSKYCSRKDSSYMDLLFK